MTGRFPARGSPAARVEGCVSLTGSRRTSGCLESRLGRSEVGCRRRAAACGLGARRRGSSGEVWVRGSGLGAARGRGAANGGGCRGRAGLGWRLRDGVELAGVQAGRRRRSAAWERGERKRAVGIGFWGICRARALARRGRRPLQRALHRDGEVAAARALLDSAGRRGEGWGLQREATGGGGARQRRVGASARWSNGRNGREGVGGGAVGGVGGEKQSREGAMVIRVDLQLPKVPGISL